MLGVLWGLMDTLIGGNMVPQTNIKFISVFCHLGIANISKTSNCPWDFLHLSLFRRCLSICRDMRFVVTNRYAAESNVMEVMRRI